LGVVHKDKVDDKSHNVEMHTMREIINVDVASFRLLGGAMLLRSRKRVGLVQPVEAYLLK
jgi:hypothetical protein